MVTKVEFIMYYTLFLFAFGTIVTMIGQTTETGISDYYIPEPPSNPVEFIGYVMANIGFFFNIMTSNATFTVLGIAIFTPFLITMIWIILELIRGV